MSMMRANCVMIEAVQFQCLLLAESGQSLPPTNAMRSSVLLASKESYDIVDGLVAVKNA